MMLHTKEVREKVLGGMVFKGHVQHLFLTRGKSIPFPCRCVSQVKTLQRQLKQAYPMLSQPTAKAASQLLTLRW